MLDILTYTKYILVCSPVQLLLLCEVDAASVQGLLEQQPVPLLVTPGLVDLVDEVFRYRLLKAAADQAAPLDERAQVVLVPGVHHRLQAPVRGRGGGGRRGEGRGGRQTAGRKKTRTTSSARGRLRWGERA